MLPPFRQKVPILHDISGYIPKNCLCGIIGQSGAGKTTLLGLLAGIPKIGTKIGDIAVSTKRIAFVAQVKSISIISIMNIPITDDTLTIFDCRCHILQRQRK